MEESYELMSFRFPREFAEALRRLKVILNKDMSLIIIEAVYEYAIKKVGGCVVES
ncbi:MAG: hypothetical protein QXG39_04115 [Candidatus Aenigmatarchaeota archaeon]